MLKWFTTIIPILYCSVAFSTCITYTALEDIKVNAQSFVINQSKSFRVEQPPGWVLKDNSFPSLYELRAPMGKGTGVGIYQLPYPNGSLSDFTRNYTSTLDRTYKVLSNNMTSLSDLPAYQSLYHDSSKGTTVWATWTLKDGDVFIIYYLAHSNQFDNYLQDAIKFVNSFRFE